MIASSKELGAAKLNKWSRSSYDYERLSLYKVPHFNFHFQKLWRQIESKRSQNWSKGTNLIHTKEEQFKQLRSDNKRSKPNNWVLNLGCQNGRLRNQTRWYNCWCPSDHRRSREPESPIHRFFWRGLLHPSFLLSIYGSFLRISWGGKT